MKYVIALLAGLIIGILLAEFLIVKGNAKNIRVGRDKVEIEHYVRVNDQWIKRETK